MKRFVTLCLASLAIAACSKDEPAGPVGASPDEAPAADDGVDSDVLARLGDADAFKPDDAKPYGAKACARADIEKLEVLVCTYADAATAEGNTAIRDFLAGAQSGLVRVSGTDVAAIADRSGADPKGEVVARLAAAFAPTPAAP